MKIVILYRPIKEKWGTTFNFDYTNTEGENIGNNISIILDWLESAHATIRTNFDSLITEDFREMMNQEIKEEG